MPGRMVQQRINLKVNGASHELDVAPGVTLLELLRSRLALRGTKEACGRGECGACTVLIGGTPVLACLSLAVRTRSEVTTIEGLEQECQDLREAFADTGGFQCGFCTPGQIVRGAALLRTGLPADPAEAERIVRYEISGNICRCTGYNGIVDAILRVAGQRRQSAALKAAAAS